MRPRRVGQGNVAARKQKIEARNRRQRNRAQLLKLRARWHREVTHRQAREKIRRSRTKVQLQAEASRRKARAAKRRQKERRDRAQRAATA
jgi:hypothetical protein